LNLQKGEELMKQEKSHPRIHKSICNECRGNGFIRFRQTLIQLWNWSLGYSRVRDCEICDSQGEITYDESKVVPFNNHRDSACPHN